MARRDLTEMERYYLGVARTVLANARGLDMGDDRELARTVGRLEVVVAQLLRIADPDTDDDGGA